MNPLIAKDRARDGAGMVRAACCATLLLVGCASAPPPAAPRAEAQAQVADGAWLDRLTWGANTTAGAEWRREGRQAWLERQLRAAGPAPLPPAAEAQLQAMRIVREPMADRVRSMEAQRKAADALTDDAARQAAQQAYQQAMNALAREAATRSLLRALYSPRQLQSQMAWFWFNHFNVHQYKHNLRAMVGDYEAGLHDRALGRFRDLLEAAVLHPAMLRYLDNEQNAAGHVNENLARELLELHTLGVDGGYTQRDVQELARVLTGVGVNFGDAPPRVRPALQAQVLQRGAMLFNPARHDPGDKTVLGQTIKGSGFAEVEQVLDRLARHPSTARFVCRKIAQYFVADAPPQALVERMAARFLDSDGRIADVLSTMFGSPEFAASLGTRFKDPAHYVVSAVRLAYDDKVILNAGPMIGWLNRLGEGPFNRQTPDGYPMDETAWASPGQMNTRFEVARAIGSGSAGLFRAEGGTVADRPAFPQLANAWYYGSMAPRLAPATRQALDQAASPQEWNTLLLASPDFMRH